MEIKEMSYREALRLAMSEEMRQDEDVIFLGEDIGVYGGTFHVSTGMLDEFGEDRVLDTPISESTIVGCAAGAALTGMRPICEMMFMDFIAFGMDSLANQAAKLRYMFGGEAQVPMVLRLPSGSGTGAAAQHSQSLEAWLCHVPGLKVVTPSTPAQAKGLLKAAIRDNNPVCFVEHKMLYGMKGPVPVDEDYAIALGKSFVERKGSDVTVVSWGRCLVDVIEVAGALEEESIDIEVINPMTLYPMDMEPIYDSVKKTGRLLVVHEAAKTGGVGGEIVSKVVESDCFDYMQAPVIRLGGLDVPIPHSEGLERAVLPQKEDIVDAVYRLMGIDA
ncbi:MAG: alpha-ketoacid dehydrogenase subunit beta [Eubacterium aggregans]|uniref:Pyruvate dehydrogenase E1 component beta subunit n=1 Tax=Eubacterium aggregans TaxID=81409 RepID=A0A1H3ZZQ6_9FIRM|nr:alpha-ketoacid dehydrogenase subunit beta [Eubacterium aggregans]MDD4691637.1 alpha-ketoacid dehydrogenase subunit beta [Eubacterium aggregans]MEA5074256.1 alpha-ketoacid dehydrogenase subunit beta [Eubacterium aggregans]SEA29186.1 pyruvate dehydrogenase E1 component beta subunit [Eubacterium aggregans]